MAPPSRKHRSLFGEILDWMLAPLLLLWPLSVLLTWLVAQGLANQPFDRELGAKVRYLARQVEFRSSANGGTEAAFDAAERTGACRTTATFSITRCSARAVSASPATSRSLCRPTKTMRCPAKSAFATSRSARSRSASATCGCPGSERSSSMTPLVQVAETLDKRSRLATEIIKGVILPQFVILPVAVLLVWLALARGIAPLNELQQRIRRRDSNDLSPIDENAAPEEVSPLVRAINDLLERLDHSIRAQKHFLADAAHQLKTPLAGLRTQAELAQREIDEGQSDPRALKESLQQIARSSQNAAHMVNQLLAMARAEDEEQGTHREAVSLTALATETVRDFVPRALEKRIDLGFEGSPGADEKARAAPLWVSGNAVLLREMIRNLVDNALQYTPAGGTVTVRVMDDPFGQVVVLQVEDSGPGIAPAEREQVFHPFYRSLGTECRRIGPRPRDRARDRHPPSGRGQRSTTPSRAPRNGAAASGPGALFTLRFSAMPVAESAGDSRRPIPPPRRRLARLPPTLRDHRPRSRASALHQPPALRDRHQDAEPEPERHHRGAAIADEGQRHADDRQDAAHHAHVDEGIGEEAQRDRTGQQPRESGRRLGGDHQAAKYQEHEAEHQTDAAREAEFLGERGKDEVGGALRNEFEVRLRALHEALAFDAARADRDHALDDVEPLAERVGGRIEQRADAVLLVVAQQRPLDVGLADLLFRERRSP